MDVLLESLFLLEFVIVCYPVLTVLTAGLAMSMFGALYLGLRKMMSQKHET